MRNGCDADEKVTAPPRRPGFARLRGEEGRGIEETPYDPQTDSRTGHPGSDNEARFRPWGRGRVPRKVRVCFPSFGMNGR